MLNPNGRLALARELISILLSRMSIRETLEKVAFFEEETELYQFLCTQVERQTALIPLPQNHRFFNPVAEQKKPDMEKNEVQLRL